MKDPAFARFVRLAPEYDYIPFFGVGPDVVDGPSLAFLAHSLLGRMVQEYDRYDDGPGPTDLERRPLVQPQRWWCGIQRRGEERHPLERRVRFGN